MMPLQFLGYMKKIYHIRTTKYNFWAMNSFQNMGRRKSLQVVNHSVSHQSLNPWQFPWIWRGPRASSQAQRPNKCLYLGVSFELINCYKLRYESYKRLCVNCCKSQKPCFFSIFQFVFLLM